jgi:hypothetical protein
LSLAWLVALAAWVGFSINNRPETSGLGGDFHQFYAAGKAVARGQSSRLYDQPYFRYLQAEFREDPLYSLYPPTMGLAMSPLGHLSLKQALWVWWLLQAASLLVTGFILYSTSTVPPAWRGLMLLALAGSLPVWIAIGIGHLAPLLLPFLAGGLALHRSGRTILAGLLLSALALKPQLAAGLGMWMLARRDVRTLIGLALGFGLQVLLVCLTIGSQCWLDFFHAMPVIAGVTRAYRYSPLFEQSLPGIVCNLLHRFDVGEPVCITAMRATYVLVAGTAAVLLCRIVMFTRPYGRAAAADPGAISCEYACGVLFMTLIPPYFLVYDLTLLVVPIAYLWSSPAWRWGIALHITTTVLVTNTAYQLGFSLTAMTILATMVAVAWGIQGRVGGARDFRKSPLHQCR